MGQRRTRFAVTRRARYSLATTIAVRTTDLKAFRNELHRYILYTAMAEEYRFRLHVEQVENGDYLATCESLPGLVAQGRTVQETIEIAQDVARKLLESYREHGDPLPRDLARVEREADFDVAITA